MTITKINPSSSKPVLYLFLTDATISGVSKYAVARSKYAVAS